MGILNAILKLFFDYFGSFQLHYSTFNDGIIGCYDCLGTVEDAWAMQGTKKAILHA